MKIQTVLCVVPIAGLLLVAAALAETEPSPAASENIREGETSVLVKEKPAKATRASRKPSTNKTAVNNPAENYAARQQALTPAESKSAAQRNAKKTAIPQSPELGLSPELGQMSDLEQPPEFQYSNRQLSPAEIEQLSRRVEPSSSKELRLAAPLLPDLPGRNVSAGVPSTPNQQFSRAEQLPAPAKEDGKLVGPQLMAPQQTVSDRQSRPQAILPDAQPRTQLPPAELRQSLREAPRVVPGMFASFTAPVYPNVRVKDSRNIAPGAAPMLVAVKDPQACKHNCDCCRDRMVFVEVWAPPYGTPRRKVRDGGREVELDYGEYEVEIESKHRGYVEIDYDD